MCSEGSGIPHSSVATFLMMSIAAWRLARAVSASVSTKHVCRLSGLSAGEPAFTPGAGGPIRAPVSLEIASSRSKFRGSEVIRSMALGPV